MVSSNANELFILGVTRQGKTFRPSDWAERLAGVMSQFRPGGPQPGSHLAYSPWCVPTSIGSVKCVIVHRDLRDYDVMAWDFCVNFARDNDLQVSETRPQPQARPAPPAPAITSAPAGTATPAVTPASAATPAAAQDDKAA